MRAVAEFPVVAVIVVATIVAKLKMWGILNMQKYIYIETN